MVRVHELSNVIDVQVGEPSAERRRHTDQVQRVLTVGQLEFLFQKMHNGSEKPDWSGAARLGRTSSSGGVVAHTFSIDVRSKHAAPLQSVLRFRLHRHLLSDIVRGGVFAARKLSGNQPTVTLRVATAIDGYGAECRRERTQVNMHIGTEHTPEEWLPAPVLAIHPEDTRIPRTTVPECGRLGRYRGTAAARLRYRMQDMIRIIGGRPAPPGKWPWQVAVLNRFKEAFCGGTLINLRWVVTAAHCVRRRLYVRLGEHDLLLKNRGEVEMRVIEAVVHPRYDPDTVVNDVALLRLPLEARPALGHGIACLPRPNSVLPPHSPCVILGWGKKRATDIHGTRILHEAQVSTIQQGTCRRSYWQYAITDDMVCAGRGRRDSCAGDSGGPLLCRGSDMKYYLQGITSFGDGCGKRGKYGIYTRTAGYVTWIQDVMSHNYFD